MSSRRDYPTLVIGAGLGGYVVGRFSRDTVVRHDRRAAQRAQRDPEACIALPAEHFGSLVGALELFRAPPGRAHQPWLPPAGRHMPPLASPVCGIMDPVQLVGLEV